VQEQRFDPVKGHFTFSKEKKGGKIITETWNLSDTPSQKKVFDNHGEGPNSFNPY